MTIKCNLIQGMYGLTLPMHRGLAVIGDWSGRSATIQAKSMPVHYSGTAMSDKTWHGTAWHGTARHAWPRHIGDYHNAQRVAPPCSAVAWRAFPGRCGTPPLPAPPAAPPRLPGEGERGGEDEEVQGKWGGEVRDLRYYYSATLRCGAADRPEPHS